MVLRIKEKQRLFILTPGAQTVNPEQVADMNSRKDLWSLIMFLGGKAWLHLHTMTSTLSQEHCALY